ncbi:MAG: hypothetical protein ABH883_04340 [Candidatus Omnitrophota bacterium]
MKTGTASLPPRGGKAPRWLFDRMKLLAREISLVIMYETHAARFMTGQ